jgi:hypothetical protein
MLCRLAKPALGGNMSKYLRCLVLFVACVGVTNLHAQNIPVKLVTATCSYDPSDRQTTLTGGWYNGPPVTCDWHAADIEGSLKLTDPAWTCEQESNPPQNRCMQQVIDTVYGGGRTGCVQTTYFVCDYTSLTMKPDCSAPTNVSEFSMEIFQGPCC